MPNPKLNPRLDTTLSSAGIVKQNGTQRRLAAPMKANVNKAGPKHLLHLRAVAIRASNAGTVR